MNTETYGSFTKAQLSMQTKAQLSMQIEHLAISMGSTWRESCVGGNVTRKCNF